jgi:AcrR family transcriptional regulator
VCKTPGLAEQEWGPALARARIVDAMATLASERKFSDTSVAAICASAKVSRQTFYDAFDGREACFRAVMDLGAAQARLILSRAFECAQYWQDGVRMALADFLLFADAEPGLTRVWLIDSMTAGLWALEHRERHVAAINRIVLERWPALAHAAALPSAGVMSSMLGVVQSHLIRGAEQRPLALLGSLMGIATTPYLPPAAVHAEIERAEALARDLLAQPHAVPRVTPEARPHLPFILCNPRAHRARRCLLYIAHHSGASNREVANAVGISSHSQASAVLARLARDGLLERASPCPGYANAWKLTPFARELLDLDTSHPARTMCEPTVTS